jgi:hypothetical protein
MDTLSTSRVYEEVPALIEIEGLETIRRVNVRDWLSEEPTKKAEEYHKIMKSRYNRRPGKGRY